MEAITEKQIIPALRFSEFSDVWMSKRLKDLLNEKIANGETVEKTNFVIEEFNFYLVQLNDLFKSSIELDVYNLMRVKLKSKAKKLKINDVIINRVSIKPSGVAKTSIVSNLAEGIDTSFESNMFRVRFQPEYIEPLFFCYFSLSSFYIKQKLALAKVTNQASLSQGDIGFINIPFPTLPEQQKIATFLSSVDEKLQQLTKKKSLLADYKKGIMQKIFSQELRFKDANGNNYPNWEEKKLGDLCGITTGKLDANAMVINGKYRFYTCAKDYCQIDKYEFDTDALIISGNGANVGYVHHFNGKFNAYQRTYVLDGFEDSIYYLRHFLDNHLYKRIFREKKDGATPYIVMSTLSDMKISLPILSEQQKIANFLSALDAKIEAVSTQINNTQAFKKGLLQQMFV